MFCLKCGAENDFNNVFCQKCGAVLEKDNSTNINANNPNHLVSPQQEINSQVNAMPVETQGLSSSQTQPSQSTIDNNQNEKKSDNLGTISLVLGIVSLLSSLVFLSPYLRALLA